MPASKDHWWGHVGNWVQVMVGFLTLGTFVFVAVMAAMQSWADDRYVQHPQLVEALGTLRKQDLEDQIEELQDDIVFFSDSGAEGSVKRRCRKLPKVIRKWEEHTAAEWEPDPIVRNACGTVQ